MLTLLSTLFGFVGPIVKQIADERAKRADLESMAEKIAADERIKALEAKRDVLIARSGQKIDGIVRAMFAVPIAIYYGKIFMWDKAFDMGGTDPLRSADLTEFAMVVVGGYFLHAAIGRLAR